MDQCVSDSALPIKHDWYQTESSVNVSLLIKNVKQEELRLNITDQNVTVEVCVAGKNHYLSLELFSQIDAVQSSHKILSSKIELKLKKKEGIWWNSLTKTVSLQDVQIPKVQAADYPSSAPKKHDWDKIVADVTKEEASEKGDADGELNKLFQKIYSDGSDEVRRAMNKSFMESGGTVLSTNWKEVAKEHVDVKPPDGTEWKSWEK